MRDKEYRHPSGEKPVYYGLFGERNVSKSFLIPHHNKEFIFGKLSLGMGRIAERALCNLYIQFSLMGGLWLVAK